MIKLSNDGVLQTLPEQKNTIRKGNVSALLLEYVIKISLCVEREKRGDVWQYEVYNVNFVKNSLKI